MYHVERLNYSLTARVNVKRKIFDRCFQIRKKRFFSNVIALVPESIF